MSDFTEQHPYVQQALERAERDAAFRRRLKRNPRAAIQEETGIDVPAGFDIRFVERFGRRRLKVIVSETAERLHNEEEATLDVADLEAVAGGLGLENGELSLDDLEGAAGGTGGDPPPPPIDPW